MGLISHVLTHIIVMLAPHSFHTMCPHRSKSSRLSHSHNTNSTNNHHQSACNATTKTHRKTQKDEPEYPVLLSNPIEGEESDTHSFDKEDMYGSDTGVISVSMKPQPMVEASPENYVCLYIMWIAYNIVLHLCGRTPTSTPSLREWRPI